MTKSWSVVGAAAGPLLLLVACGGSDDDDGSFVALEDVPVLYAAATCNAVEDCLGPLFEIFMRGEDCTQRTEDAVRDSLPALQQRIADGTIVYRGDQVEACVSELEQRGCDALIERNIDTCNRTFDGTVELGGGCTLSEECSGKAYCRFDDSCPGTCSTPEGAGDGCQEDGDCESGLLCSDATGACYEPAGPGDACGGAGDPECTPGLVCVGEDEATGQAGNCRTVDEAFSAEVGETCAATGPLCKPELVCALQSATADGVELNCERRVGSGAACKVAFPDACPDDEYCRVQSGALEGTCTTRPAAGQPCGSAPFSEAPSVCAAYARCEEGTCRSLQEAGGSCISSEVCLSENCVDGECIIGGTCE